MERMPMLCAMGLTLKDIPDNKAFFSCERGCAKSHLNWAEAFWLLLGSKSNNEIGNP